MSDNENKSEILNEVDGEAADVFEELQQEIDDEIEAEIEAGTEADEIEADEVETISNGIFGDDDFSFSDEIAALICESVNTPAEQIGAKTISAESQKFLAGRYARFGKKIAPMFGNKELGPVGEGMVAILATGAIAVPSIISIRKRTAMMLKMMKQQQEAAKAKAAKDVTPKNDAKKKEKIDTPKPENTL